MSAPAHEPEPAPADGSPGGGPIPTPQARQVLIVDDNEEYAENIAEILEGEGLAVTVAFRPSVALELAPRTAFDIALLDFRMPEMDGVALLRQLLEQRPLARYVIITAFASDARVDEALRLGAQAVLSKPVEMPRLIELAIG